MRCKDTVQEEYPDARCVRSHCRSFHLYVGDVLIVWDKDCAWKAWDQAYCNLILLRNVNGWTKEQAIEFLGG